ncbi:MmgE/PrpD family protein [Chloroflexota bacterium]
MNETMTDKLANFVVQAQYADLPEEVSHEVKRVLLDSVGCAFGGHSTERGKIAGDLAMRLGGPPESTIIGVKNKVSCTNAAFANGELINALDFDALSAAGHDVPCLISAALALAESCSTTGKNLILAIALSFEISHRLDLKVPPIAEGSDRGKLRWPQVLGQSAATLAVAASAGKILNLDKDKLANAISIAGFICPPNVSRKCMTTAPFRMTKYGPAGAVAQAGITSALLAEMGYTGDTDLFDGEFGFWTYIGQGEWEKARGEKVLSDLGVEWYSHMMNYKQYPCGI